MKAFVLEKNVYPHLCRECIHNDVKIHTKPSALEAGRQKEKVGIKGNFHILQQEMRNSSNENENMFAILPV